MSTNESFKRPSEKYYLDSTRAWHLFYTIFRQSCSRSIADFIFCSMRFIYCVQFKRCRIYAYISVNVMLCQKNTSFRQLLLYNTKLSQRTHLLQRTGCIQHNRRSITLTNLALKVVCFSIIKLFKYL